MFKNGKAPESEFISNEMIKYGMLVLLKPLYKLFNLIFSNDTFPKSWDESIIALIYKRDDTVIKEKYQ